MKLLVNICMVLLLAIHPLFAAEKQTQEPDLLKDATIKTYKTIGEDVNLKLYLFNPADHKVTDKSPAIVFFFGGGWNGGTPTQFALQAKYLASRGMVAICAEYRTKKSHGTSPFECVKDAKSAVRWIRTNAKDLGIDGNRIAAAGGSAGGHLAAATATVTNFDEDKDKSISCVPNALVLFNPVFDNGPNGFGYERIKDQYKKFSPIDNIKKGLPPTLVMLGTKDQLIPVKTAERFKALAEKVNTRCDLKLYKGQRHGFFNQHTNKEMYFETTRDMDIFLTSIGYLKGKPTSTKAMVQAADSGPGSTKGIIDIAEQNCPAGARQLVGETGYDMVPETDAKCQWTFKDGVLTASPSWDSVITRQSYRDFRMHLEFNINNAPDVDPEKNGNSGVYIQQRYEIQILNSHGVSQADYKHSYCGSLYRMKKPDKLVTKPAGQWQSYDIAFRAARFDGDKKVENARITVYQNQQLIHDDVSIPSQTGAGKKEGPDPRPIKLQGHKNQVRFRNVWIQVLNLDKMAAAKEKK